MEFLGAEFGDMSPQELAAPVNTVAVSFEQRKIEFKATGTTKLTLWWLATEKSVEFRLVPTRRRII